MVFDRHCFSLNPWPKVLFRIAISIKKKFIVNEINENHATNQRTFTDIYYLAQSASDFLAHLSRSLVCFSDLICQLLASLSYTFHIFIFFTRTTGRPISAKFGTKHHWVKEIQISSNEGPCPFPGEEGGG